MGILDGIVEWIAEQVMAGLDLVTTSVLGALGCDMAVFLRYFPAAETPGYSGGRHGSGQPAVVYAADVDLSSGSEEFEAVLVGHSSPDGSSGGIDPDISGLTSALRIVERITIRVR